MTTILPCDILLTRSKSKLGALIRFFTRRPFEDKSVASHCGIFSEEGDLDTAILIEAQSNCNKHSMKEAYGSDESTELCIFRPINLTDEEKALILAKANFYVNKKYGYFKLLLHLGDWLLGGLYLFRRLGRMDNYPICSYVVSHAFGAANKTFGIANDAASPDDIWDFCLKNPLKYQFIWQKGTMYKESK